MSIFAVLSVLALCGCLVLLCALYPACDREIMELRAIHRDLLEVTRELRKELESEVDEHED